MERLDKGLVDFGVLIEPYDVSKYDYSRLPAQDTWGVLMRKDSHLAAGRRSGERLAEVAAYLFAPGIGGGQLSSWFKADYGKLNMVSSYNLLYNASLLAESGLGYVVCIDNIMNTTGKSSLCFRPLKPALKAQVNSGRSTRYFPRHRNFFWPRFGKWRPVGPGSFEVAAKLPCVIHATGKEE
ncbi:MAG: hypothetical protein LIP28_04845 [Deltaproteobacteria bacterium]|nr:hypothetical protein [Deltaproteobacteria bacterium]